MIFRTYLQVLGVCMIGAFFITSFLQDGTEVLAKTYDTVRMRNLDMFAVALTMDGGFTNEADLVCGHELNTRLSDLLPGYTSDPNGLNIPGCNDGFAFVPFASGGGGVLVTIVEDRDQANFNYTYGLTMTSKKLAIDSICQNGTCDDLDATLSSDADQVEHVGYYAKIVSL